MKNKYCLECNQEKPENEFAKGSYFCRKCKEKYGDSLFMAPEPSLESIFARLEKNKIVKPKYVFNRDNAEDKFGRKNRKKKK